MTSALKTRLLRQLEQISIDGSYGESARTQATDMILKLHAGADYDEASALITDLAEDRLLR